jgi:hypothetical protein
MTYDFHCLDNSCQNRHLGLYNFSVLTLLEITNGTSSDNLINTIILLLQYLYQGTGQTLMREQKVHMHFLGNWKLAKPKQMLQNNIKLVPTQAGTALKWLRTGFNGRISNVEL